MIATNQPTKLTIMHRTISFYFSMRYHLVAVWICTIHGLSYFGLPHASTYSATQHYTKPFYTSLQTLCGTRCNQGSYVLSCLYIPIPRSVERLSIVCLQGLCRMLSHFIIGLMHYAPFYCHIRIAPCSFVGILSRAVYGRLFKARFVLPPIYTPFFYFASSNSSRMCQFL